MRTNIIIVVVALLILGIAGAGWWSLAGRNGKDKTRQLRWGETTRGKIENVVDANGSVVPFNRVEIKPPISGRVVQEGARVKKGQIIAWMSSSDRAAILDAARAQGSEAVKHWEDAYKATPVIAPLDGVIILKNVVVGQEVDSSNVVYAMSDELIVLAQVDESDIGKVKLGMPARIVLDSYPNSQTPGKVFDILYEGKNVSSVITYGVKVRPLSVPSFFRSQMTANISFIVGHKDDALLVPAPAVQVVAGGGKQVMVPGPDGKPVPRPVTTGIESGDKIEVVSGIEEGDQVLVSKGRYVAQQGPQASPLAFGGPRQSGPTGQAPRQRGGSQAAPAPQAAPAAPR